MKNDERAVADGAAFDSSTLQYYTDTAPTYAGSGRGGRNRFLDHFTNKLAPGSRVLDLGCGGAIDAAAMLDCGLMVDATEGSPSLAAVASERLGQKVSVMRFDELDAVEAYDAVWASASLIHVPRAALSSVLARIYAALKPGGIHFATYKSGGIEGRDSVGRYYNYPSAEELRTFYAQSAAWDIALVEDYVGGGFETGTGPWLAIEAYRKRL